MTRPSRPLARWMTLALVTAGFGLAGCGEPDGDPIETTPGELIGIEVPEEGDAVAPTDAEIVEDEPVVVDPPAEPEMPVTPSEPTAPEPEPASPEPTDTDAASADAIELRPVTLEELKAHIAEAGAPLTLVDCWASWCDPCKENFPHVIEMADTFEDKGLKVIALSFDAGTEVDDIDEAQIKEAKRFLSALDVSKIENLRHGQLLFDSFELFGVTTIPAVFLYDAEGNEIARFTYDDPDNQFTYDEVEAKVAELLAAE